MPAQPAIGQNGTIRYVEVNVSGRARPGSAKEGAEWQRPNAFGPALWRALERENKMPSLLKRNLSGCLPATILAATFSLLGATDTAFAADLSIGKVGTEAEFVDVTHFCGTKPIRVGIFVGFGSVTREIRREDVEDEAKKCPNIKAVRYTQVRDDPSMTDVQFQPLAEPRYDIIIVQPGSGAAAIPALHYALRDGSVVIPVEVGVTFPGKPGVDYTVAVTPNEEQMASVFAQYLVDTLHGKGNVIVWGGTPGALQTAEQALGWRKVFAANPGITVLEGPVVSNWDLPTYQKVTTALLAKYPQIDGMYSDYGFGMNGAVFAFQDAHRPLVPITGRDDNRAECMWVDFHKREPKYQIGFTNSWRWLGRLALRKGLAAVNGIDSTEPSVVNVSMVIDSTSSDPKMRPNRDNCLPK
jgi:ribose transport system substrate-binding protein